MKLEELKQSIKEKELRLSQLQTMDINRLKAAEQRLIKELEQEISKLREKLGQE